MTITDYLISVLLIAVILRQVRPHRLTFRTAFLPLLLLAAAAIVYLRPPFPAGGSDLRLIAVLLAAGACLGLVSGAADRIWTDQAGQVIGRAGLISVAAWVAGMGARFAFEYWAYHSGGPAIARFSRQHEITGASAWSTALFLMAFGQVVARLAVLQIRRLRLAARPAVVPAAP